MNDQRQKMQEIWSDMLQTRREIRRVKREIAILECALMAFEDGSLSAATSAAERAEAARAAREEGKP